MHPALPAPLQVVLAKSQAHYQRYARLALTVDTLGPDKLAWCSAHQTAMAANGTILSAAEIMERASEVFAPLQAAGYTPIISIYELNKGTPNAPIKKHRSTVGVVVRGMDAVVLRQAPPRMLFTMEGGSLEPLAAEHTGSLQQYPQLTYKAAQWLKRARFRS